MLGEVAAPRASARPGNRWRRGVGEVVGSSLAGETASSDRTRRRDEAVSFHCDSMWVRRSFRSMGLRSYPARRRCPRRPSPSRRSRAADRGGYGPRLPLLVISPYAKANYVDHSVTDQGPPSSSSSTTTGTSDASATTSSTPRPARSRRFSISRAIRALTLSRRASSGIAPRGSRPQG